MTHPSDRQSIRDEMRGTIESGIVLSQWDDEQIMFAAKITDLIMGSPVIRRIQADTLRKFRADLIGDQFVRYGIVIPDVSEVVDDLDTAADRIEKGGATDD